MVSPDGFSVRSRCERDHSPWARALFRARHRGRLAWDLTITNPTQVGLTYPAAVYAALGDPADAVYDPQPLGQPAARQAVADYYRDAHGIAVDPQHVWLCASTSEAYAHLLTLLCDPGDAVAVPRPGYPLLDSLADVSGVRRVDYPVRYDGHWHVDVAGLRAAVHGEARLGAIVSVSPNNPTGNVLTATERDAIAQLCGPLGPAHIVDEVFADYPLESPRQSTATPRPDAGQAGLSFVVSGLSKVAALPQMKLSWIVVGGTNKDRIASALWRAQVLADVFLSVATPVQRALPRLLAAAPAMRARIGARLSTNLAVLREAAVDQPWQVLHVDAGWTALLRLPQGLGLDDEGWATTLLDRAGVATSPGFLFDTHPGIPLLAVSLLVEPPRLAGGVAALRRAVTAVLAEENGLNP